MPPDTTSLGVSAVTGAGARGGGAPPAPGVLRGAGRGDMFGGLFWFDHLHVIPRLTDLGNIVRTTVRTFEVYNGYAVIQTVTEVLLTGMEGVAVTSGSTTPPLPIGARKALSYSITVDINGPPSLNAALRFGVPAIGRAVTTIYTGTRAVLLSHPCQRDIVERWRWLTDVIEAADGTEQRIAVWDLPRLSLRYRFVTLNEQDAALLLNTLRGWSGRRFTVPLWADITTLTAQATPGALSLTVAATGDRDFRAEGLVVLWASPTSWEVLPILSIGGATTLNLSGTAGVAGTWPVGSLVMPAVGAYLARDPDESGYKATARDVTLELDAVGGADYASEAGFSTYQGLPLFDDALTFDGGTYREAMTDVRRRHDAGSARAYQSSRTNLARSVVGYNFDATTRAALWRLKRFLHARRGRQVPCWVSTRRPDLIPVSSAAPPATTVQVAPSEFARLVFPHRAHVEIVYVNGSRDLRQILSAARFDDRDDLLLDAAISQTFSTANVARASMLLKRRLASDAVEFVYRAPGLAAVPVGLYEVED